MNNKNDIKKTISLAVLAVLIQNNQAIGWGKFLSPGFLVKKVAKATKNFTVKIGQGIFHNGVEKIILRSQKIQDAANPELFVPAHTRNSCWLNTMTMIFNACVSDQDLEIILNKLKKYKKDEWVVMKKGHSGKLERDRDLLIDDGTISKANLLDDDITALKLLVEDCKEMRKGKKSKIQRLRRETREAFGYYGYNAFSVAYAMRMIIDAMKYCGYDVKWDTVTSDITAELDKRKNCKRVGIPIYGKEPATGHGHVYCVIATNENGNWVFREMNDMSGKSILTTRFYGYSEKRSLEQLLALTEESKKLNNGNVEMVTIRKNGEL